MADFFDKFKSELNKNIAIVNVGSKNLVEKNRLNGSIRTLEAKKKHSAEEIGAKVYNLWFENPSSPITLNDFDQFCREIQDCDNQIADLNAEIKKLDMEMEVVKNTPAYVEEEKPEETVEVVENAQTERNAVCKCGHVNREGAKFCGMCGESL